LTSPKGTLYSRSRVIQFVAFVLRRYLSLETERLPQLLAMALLGGFALHFARLLTIQSVEPRPPTLTVSCVFAGLLALAVGRVHFDRWRHLFPPYGHYAVPDNFCCTQAVFYARQAAVDLADYLDVVRCNETFHKDDALWSFGRSTGHGAKAGLLVQPNLFEHVGLYSGLRGGFVDPHIFIADK
jgi:hypothetical protein